jgi:F-type H+-transporting ATPase subunit delta
MIQGSLVRRYAKALLSLSHDEGKLDAVRAETQGFAGILKDNPLLKATLSNSTLAVSDRKAILTQVAGKLNASPLFRNFLFLVLEKDRMDLFEDIALELKRLADQQSGRLRAKVRVAKSLPPGVQKELAEALSRSTGKTIEIDVEVDPAVIGGLSAQIGNTVFDGTVATHLEKMKQRLLQNDIGH